MTQQATNGTIHKVRYSVTFEATVFVPEGGSLKDEVANINIPEDDVSHYVTDTFDVEVDESGEPVKYED
jgi:hypothetical protein